jgi:CRP-like cAMP-binding protein
MRKNDTWDRDQGISGLLEHVEILKDNIRAIKAPETSHIRTKSDAEQTVIEIQALQEKVEGYQKTARILREVLERQLH